MCLEAVFERADDKEGEDTNFAYIFNPDLNFNDLLHTVLMEFDLASIDEQLSKNEAKHRIFLHLYFQ